MGRRGEIIKDLVFKSLEFILKTVTGGKTVSYSQFRKISLIIQENELEEAKPRPEETCTR